MQLSIVVPVLDEARELPSSLAALRRLADEGADVLVVDGGSSDDTAGLARAAGLRVVTAPRGRARQMNAGAAQTRGDVLLFLHADTLLPDAAIALVAARIAAGDSWGRFDVRIIGRSPWLRIIAAAMNLRSRITGIATGDQALFLTRATFDRLGGFADQPLMEDIELCRRLRRIAAPACIRTPVHTSGRRWESRGVWRTILLMWRMRWDYWRGVPASELAGRYR